MFFGRYIAVTQPIKYAKHKNNNRVIFTIILVWVTSAAIGAPLVLGEFSSEAPWRRQQCVLARRGGDGTWAAVEAGTMWRRGPGGSGCRGEKLYRRGH